MKNRDDYNWSTPKDIQDEKHSRRDEFGDAYAITKKRKRQDPSVCRKTKGEHILRLKNKGWHIIEKCTECGIERYGTPLGDIRRKLIKIRKDRKITQAEIANKMATQQPSIARFESLFSGKDATIDFLQNYAAALGVRIKIEIEE